MDELGALSSDLVSSSATPPKTLRASPSSSSWVSSAGEGLCEERSSDETTPGPCWRTLAKIVGELTEECLVRNTGQIWGLGLGFGRSHGRDEGVVVKEGGFREKQRQAVMVELELPLDAIGLSETIICIYMDRFCGR